MANPNKPFGARVWSSEGKELRAREYIKKTSVAIYDGDLVTADATGTVDVAAAGESILGVAAETQAAAAANIKVIDDPGMIIEMQVDGDFALADIFLNADFVATAADTTIGRSKHVLDSSTMATTGELPLKVIGLSPSNANAVGSYARVLCKINNTIMGHSTGIAGV